MLVDPMTRPAASRSSVLLHEIDRSTPLRVRSGISS